MNADLIAHIKARIAELEPLEKDRYTEVKNLEEQVKAYSKPYELARDQWCELYTELKNLKGMLPPEQRNEPTTEKPLPI